MNKKQKNAWRKHRIKKKKFEERLKAAKAGKAPSK